MLRGVLCVRLSRIVLSILIVSTRQEQSKGSYFLEEKQFQFLK